MPVLFGKILSTVLSLSNTNHTSIVFCMDIKESLKVIVKNGKIYFNNTFKIIYYF